MYIDFNRKFVFIAVPKTASRSMHDYFFKNIVDKGTVERIWTKEKYHYPLSKIMEEYPQIKSYYKFAFVRNPFDRMVSTFLDFTLNKSTHREFADKFDSMFSNFSEFVLNFKDTEWSEEIHMMPATWYVFAEDKPADFIGRYENLNDDFGCALDYVKVGRKGDGSVQDFGHIGKTDRKSDYRSYYKNDKQIQAVYDFYKDDIDYFGYKF